MNKRFKLIKNLIDKSKNKEWDKARLEWVLDHVYESKEAQICLCTHYPINEICVIKNQFTLEMEFVGNCCIKVITGDMTKKIFNSLKKVKENKTKSVSKDLLFMALNEGVIDKYEFDFYNSIFLKKILTLNQRNFKIDINETFLQYYVVEA